MNMEIKTIVTHDPGHIDGLRSILLVSQSDVSEQLMQGLRGKGWRVMQSRPGEASSEQLDHCRIGIVQFDKFDAHFVAIWEETCRKFPGIQWLALVDKAELSDSRLRELIISCFYDFHTLPADFNRLSMALGHAYGVAQLLNDAAKKNFALNDELGLVGLSRPIVDLRRTIRKAAKSDSPVLICGESGTGKELVASSIHSESAVKDQPFIAVNCAALPRTLIQSELFGYEKGAFTGALTQKVGRIESASGGSLFLDEIGDLGPDLQVNFLRFLQEKKISRLGGHQEIPVNARVIAATHVNLEKAILDGFFRSDLFYRLNVIRIHVPPLRERQGDVELLARYFFEKYKAEKKTPIIGFSSETLALMRRYSWPGNVRELINRIRHAMVMAEGKLITPEDLGLTRDVADFKINNLETARAEAESKAILATIEYTSKNMSEAARLLGVTRATLYRLISKHNLESAIGFNARRVHIDADAA